MLAPRQFAPDAEISTGHNNNQQVLAETLAPAQGNYCGGSIIHVCVCVPFVWLSQPVMLSQGCRSRTGDLHPPPGQICLLLARNLKMGKEIDVVRWAAESAAGVWRVMVSLVSRNVRS